MTKKILIVTSLFMCAGYPLNSCGGSSTCALVTNTPGNLPYLPISNTIPVILTNTTLSVKLELQEAECSARGMLGAWAIPQDESLVNALAAELHHGVSTDHWVADPRLKTTADSIYGLIGGLSSRHLLVDCASSHIVALGESLLLLNHGYVALMNTWPSLTKYMLKKATAAALVKLSLLLNTLREPGAALPALDRPGHQDYFPFTQKRSPPLPHQN